jgi:hypothetical protein
VPWMWHYKLKIAGKWREFGERAFWQALIDVNHTIC